MQLTEFSATNLPMVEQEITQFLMEYTTDEALKESMLYSINAGGKRIRPLLLLATASSFGETLSTPIYQVAGALEMVHTYSLIHDDLPAMDNDDLRRGKPTNHKVFGEAIAILAGDGLLTGAFQLISLTQLEPLKKLLLIQQLASNSGAQGMVAGQTADILGEKQELTIEELAFVHERKTGRLIRYALLAGGVLANQPEEVLMCLQKLAGHLGLAFQIRDDLLDVVSTTEKLGKTAGKDAQEGKNTYPRLLGIEKTYAALANEIQQANELVTQLEKDVLVFDGELLRQLIRQFDMEK
ncbi:polyprenyl synthetase family protein [Enterococcus thailandicus]|uniref:Farnesyl diphosphate synthase n=1 Tax=Enterococcus thailandicus TaxID=417368 RepID=A0A1L8XS97_ENTTH|nr:MULTISPECIES: farnesyl diphosphate synthase [Enterococcus]ASZ07997.1 polyprenyl synthetase family protein [Enterococcus thailandicus]MDA3973423.1 polyprenyl synthetase family protein [Enterococcus thailandicus]MDA3975992.1 polyprenyl synthetase family protein [Enterococcus thailandicus]MDA3980882.1 polyprenyl synthetase family protein [Enterococcus thailandicus]MDK4351714.1 polyprenyl synthetase family protein [Enterococcus thailandicus]